MRVAAGRTKVVGDDHVNEASQVAAWSTPVPSGVGLMTVVVLLPNTVTAAKRMAGIEQQASADLRPSWAARCSMRDG